MARNDTPTMRGLRGMMSSGAINGIFTVGFEVDKDVRAELLSQGGITTQQFRKRLNDFTDRVGKEVAEAARDRMKEWIRPGGTYDVGDTGRSANNLEVGSTSLQGVNIWYVYEAGSDTDGNKAIRLGVPAKPDESSAARDRSEGANREYFDKMQANPGKKMSMARLERVKNPFFGAVEAWAKRKGLRPRQDDDIDEDDYVTQGTPFPKKTRRDKRREWRSMLWALWHHWKERGQSTEYRKAFGKPFFDYPARYARTEGAKTLADKKLLDIGVRDPESSISAITASYAMSVLYKRMGVTQKFGSSNLVNYGGR